MDATKEPNRIVVPMDDAMVMSIEEERRHVSGSVPTRAAILRELIQEAIAARVAKRERKAKAAA